jgi:hypothetical protein
MAQAEAISAAQARLGSLIVTAEKAAEVVATLEAALAERALQWARFSEQQDPPSLANGADLIAAREVLGKAQAQAAAARAAEPRLQAEMEAVQRSRTALEDRIQSLALDVLGAMADGFVARIGELESEIGAQCARLAALRRPAMRLAGDAMAGKRTVHGLNTAIGERRFDESAARSLEARFRQLADELVGGNASATLV